VLPDPLHPAVVHFPIALAVLLPAAALVVAVAIARGWLEARAWALVVLLHAVGAGSAWLAEETGHDQEEHVEEVLGDALHDPLHEHEEAGEWLAIVFGSTWVVTAAGLLRGRAGAAARLAAVAGAIVVVATAWRTGESGGALVYEHGAASTYATPPPASGAPPTPGHHH
jgi:uncharacterized membrane protein